MSDIQNLATKRMQKTISALHDDLNAIRTGRASAAIFDKVRVDYYGTPTPLDLGLNPSNDGKVVRIVIPALTADRRKELVKQAKNIAEQCRVAIRNIRRDANDDLKKMQKSGEITEDQLKTAEENVQKSTDTFISDINKILEDKEKEILEG